MPWSMAYGSGRDGDDNRLMPIREINMEKPSQSVIDAHAHCGVIDRSWPQSFADYARQAAGTDIKARGRILAGDGNLRPP